MAAPVLSIREIQEADIPRITDYWLTADEAYLRAMGVDMAKMPERLEWYAMLQAQLSQAYSQKQSYCLIWQADGIAVGHSNVNKINFGNDAFMHLHIWYPQYRGRGYGTEWVKLGLPLFFSNLELQTIWCEPWALNPAPNHTLQKAGFSFVSTQVNTPGWLNFEQQTNLWKAGRDIVL